MYYNKIDMPKIFKTKVRQVGTSFGILIPKDVVEEEKIEEGEEIEVSLFKQKKLEEIWEMIDKAAGSAKGAKPFVRDRIDRLERYEKNKKNKKKGKR